MNPEDLIPRHAWWDSGALEEAVSAFTPTLTKLVQEAYRREGSPYGEGGEEQWLESTLRGPQGDAKGSEAGEALQRAIGDAWAFHLQLHFAARQTN